MPIYVLVAFRERNRAGHQFATNDVFYRPTVPRAQCKIGKEKCPDGSIICHYQLEKLSQAYAETVSCFRFLTAIVSFNLLLHKISLILKIKVVKKT